MNGSRSYEIVEYRNKIMEAIVRDKELVKLLGEADSPYPDDTIPFHLVFPHEYIPETITKTERFINFDLKATLDNRNNTFKDITIWFFVVCHQEAVRYKENYREYLWYDKVVCALDELFSTIDVLGITKTFTIVDNSPYCPHQKFKGRLLTFKVKDFTKGGAYGK